MRQRTYIIPFAQNTNGDLDDLGADYGSTAYIIPWVPIGDTGESLHLYGYDDFNSESDKYYLNLLESTIENNVNPTNAFSLKYLKKNQEKINLENFQCDKLSIEVNEELNRFYELKYIIIGNQPTGASMANQTGVQYFERFEVTERDRNIYHFKINTVLRVQNIEESFIYGLKYREIHQKEQTMFEVQHDPTNTVLFKMILEGKNYVNNSFSIGASGWLDYREYRKRIYIRDATNEHGYLAYSHIKEKYRYNSNGVSYTMYEFIITDSVLYNVSVNGTDFQNDVLVPELRISHGKLVLSIMDSFSNVNPEGSKIEFCEVYLYDSELGKVPDANPKLTISKTPDYGGDF